MNKAGTPPDPSFETEADAHDRLLIRAVAKGDDHALEALYARHGAKLLGYLIRQIGERSLAEEVLQDVMLAVWKGAARFRGESKVSTWLLSIARFQAIHARNRKRGTLQRLISPEQHEYMAQQQQFAANAETPITENVAVQQALHSLPHAQQEVLELIFYYQLTNEEAAVVMGVPSGTIKSRVSRALAILRSMLTEKGERG